MNALLPQCEAPRLQGGASRSLIIFFRYMPLDPAYKAGLARHYTGQTCLVRRYHAGFHTGYGSFVDKLANQFCDKKTPHGARL